MINDVIDLGSHMINNERQSHDLMLTMLLKSAPPTPTMTMERGSLEAATILSTVRSMSQITPSWQGGGRGRREGVREGRSEGGRVGRSEGGCA